MNAPLHLVGASKRHVNTPGQKAAHFDFYVDEKLENIAFTIDNGPWYVLDMDELVVLHRELGEVLREANSEDEYVAWLKMTGDGSD